MPLSWCSAIWQWAIQTPGLVTSSRMSTVSPVRDQDGVLPDQVGLDDPVAGEDQEAARPVDVERVVHRVVGVHLVDQADLHPIADPEAPVDRGVLGAGRRGRSSFQRMLAGVVIRLTSTMSSSHSMPAGRLVVRGPWWCSWASRRPGAPCSCPAPRPRAAAGSSFMPHSGQRLGRVADDLGVHRAGVGGRRGRDGQQLHAALRASPGLLADDLGVHRAGVDDRARRPPARPCPSRRRRRASCPARPPGRARCARARRAVRVHAQRPRTARRATARPAPRSTSIVASG